MTPVFADAFYYIALISARDTWHKQVVQFSEGFYRPTVTTAFVLMEVADGSASPTERANFVRLLDALREDTDCTIIPPSRELFERGVQLYRARTDKGWSLTDCISFVVIRDLGLTEALTADVHFEQAGFAALFS